MLSVDIQKRLGKFHLNARFDVDGEPLALLGASGCGKSMTLKCIAGIEKPDSGRIVLDGRTLFDSYKQINLPPQKRRIGYLFQQYALFPNMSVEENIAAGAHAMPKAARDKKVAELIAMLRLNGLEKKSPGQLSGGQQQRTALARILASDPKVILLDEPFSALDSYLKWQLEMELADLLSTFPGSCIWVSHDRDEVYRNCGKICIMEDGSTEAVEEKHALFAAPGTVGAARLSGCKNYARAEAGDTPESVYLPEWNIHLHTGRKIPAGVTSVGLRVHSLHQADLTGENRIPCTVKRVIEDVFAYILILQVEGAAEDAPFIRMELPKKVWDDMQDHSRFTVSIAPADVLLLE